MGLYIYRSFENAPNNGSFRVFFNDVLLRKNDVFVIKDDGCVVERGGNVILSCSKDQSRETNIIWEDTQERNLNGTSVLVKYLRPPLDVTLWRDPNDKPVKSPWCTDGTLGVYVFSPPDELRLV